MTSTEVSDTELKRAIDLFKKGLDVVAIIERGDRVIFRVPGGSDFNSRAIEVRDLIQHALPGLDFLVVTDTVQVAVLRPEGNGSIA